MTGISEPTLHLHSLFYSNNLFISSRYTIITVIIILFLLFIQIWFSQYTRDECY